MGAGKSFFPTHFPFELCAEAIRMGVTVESILYWSGRGWPLPCEGDFNITIDHHLH
jgi:hypothetical protein